VRCDSIYSKFLFEHSYMYCGNPQRYRCTSNDECSSKTCSNGKCSFQLEGPSDNDSVTNVIRLLIIFVLISIILIVFIIYCCCYRKHSKK